MSDEILADILTHISQTHRLVYTPSMVRRKVHVSEVVVTTSHNLAFLNPKLQQFCNLLSEACGEGLGFEPDQIGFGTDFERTPNPIRFRFERREGVAFGDNRYFSLAPTTSEKHQMLLESLEGLLTGTEPPL
jgi:hypothetical protein